MYYVSNDTVAESFVVEAKIVGILKCQKFFFCLSLLILPFAWWLVQIEKRLPRTHFLHPKAKNTWLFVSLINGSQPGPPTQVKCIPG